MANLGPDRVVNHDYNIEITRYSMVTYMEHEKITANCLNPVPLEDPVNVTHIPNHLIGSVSEIMTFFYSAAFYE